MADEASADEVGYVEVLEAPADDLAVPAWLAGQLASERPFLLAHADDGVIWGTLVGGRLQTAYEVARKSARSAAISPKLRGETLQQAFVFGPDSEVRLFRDELGEWQARRIVTMAEDKNVIVESQLLIGDAIPRVDDQYVTLPDGFTHVYDRRQQGLDHLLPLPITPAELADGKRPRLIVHHLVTYDTHNEVRNGEARIAFSRLAGLEIGPLGSEKCQ